MPPSATSNLPRRSATAPVNAPRTWPNSSLSISSSGNRRAVDFDEGVVAAAAQRVNGPRDQFLAGAVLAVNQHAAVGRRRHRDLLAQLPHRVALADHRLRAIDPRAQRPVLGLEAPLAQRVAHDQHRLFERQRLLDEVERAHLDRAHRRFDVAVAGDQHHLRVDLPLAQPRQRGQAVHAGQPHVEHDRDRPAPRVTPLEAGLAARHRLDRYPSSRSTPLNEVRTPGSSSTMRMVGFTDVRSTFLRSSFYVPGSSIVKRVPRGALSAASMLPPCSAMIRRTIASPRPLPRPFVE